MTDSDEEHEVRDVETPRYRLVQPGDTEPHPPLCDVRHRTPEHEDEEHGNGVVEVPLRRDDRCEQDTVFLMENVPIFQCSLPP